MSKLICLVDTQLSGSGAGTSVIGTPCTEFELDEDADLGGRARVYYEITDGRRHTDLDGNVWLQVCKGVVALVTR